jgi:hypothetical protein
LYSSLTGHSRTGFKKWHCIRAMYATERKDLAENGWLDHSLAMNNTVDLSADAFL